MNKQADYTRQLQELATQMSKEELAKVLGVNLRSIQSYLRTDDPKTPSKANIKKINETFANYKRNGVESIIKPPERAADKDVILNLSESVVNLTRSNESNAENLKTMLRIIESNSGASTEKTEQHSNLRYQALLDVLVKVALGKRQFQSEDEIRVLADQMIAERFRQLQPKQKA